MNIRIYSCLMVFLIGSIYDSYAQNMFRGSLIRADDSTAIPYAAIQLLESRKTTISDAQGRFEFSLPSATRKVTIKILVMGADTTCSIEYPFSSQYKLAIQLPLFEMKEADIVGYSAADIVRKAIDAIPANYMGSSYCSFASYRNYQKINGKYANLSEQQQVVMFKLSRKGDAILADESYAFDNIRKTKGTKLEMHEQATLGEEEKMFIEQNPVYHLKSSMLNPDRLTRLRFAFDTTNSDSFYVIRYTTNSYIGEKHGVSNFEPKYFLGESYGYGKLYIDRNSYAIKRITRNVNRYPEYSYYGRPNLVYPARKFLAEFIGAQLTIDYKRVGQKWYLDKMRHNYTNEYFHAVSGTKAYAITDYYEWQSNSVSRYIDEQHANRFFYDLPATRFVYHPKDWQGFTMPFLLSPKDSVLSDINGNPEGKSAYLPEFVGGVFTAK